MKKIIKIIILGSLLLLFNGSSILAQRSNLPTSDKIYDFKFYNESINNNIPSVAYKYKGKVASLEPNEIKREFDKQIFKTDKLNEFKIRFYTGEVFNFDEQANQWNYVEYGTTTRTLWDKEFEDTLEVLFGAQASPFTSADVHIDKDNATTNYETTDPINIANDNYQTNARLKRILLEFDLSSIPSNAVVSLAELKTYAESYNEWTTQNVCAYRMTQNWTEAGVTWNKYDGSNNWAAAGGDFTVTGGVCIELSDSDTGYNTWTVTDLVSNWVNGTNDNEGFMYKPQTDGIARQNELHVISSKENEGTSQDPYLEVTYTSASNIKFTGGERVKGDVRFK